MKKDVWFRAKRYGAGWYPVTWQGFLVLFVYLTAIVPLFLIVDRTAHSVSDSLIGFSIPFIGLTTLLIVVCWLKGEAFAWRWGSEN